MNPGGGGCSELRSCHCTPVWATRARLHLKKKKKKKEEEEEEEAEEEEEEEEGGLRGVKHCLGEISMACTLATAPWKQTEV